MSTLDNTTEAKDWRKYLPPPWITALLGLGIIIWLAYSLREIVFLIVIAYSISYFIDPILKALEEKDIHRPVGIFVVGAGVLIISMVLLLTIVPRLVLEAGELIENFPFYIQKVKTNLVEFSATLENYLPDSVLQSGKVEDLIKQIELKDIVKGDFISGLAGGLFAALLRGYSVTLTLLNLALLPFIVYYLALDLRRIHYSVLLAFPKKRRLVVRRIFKEIDTTVSAYVRGQMIVASILSVLYGIGLAIVGVDLWFAIALLSGVGSMIPYVGGLIGMSLATLMGIASFGTLYHTMLIWAVFAVVQFIEGTFITPNIVGNKVGLSPLAVILALFAGASLFGLLGVFFAIPVAATLRVLSKHAARTIFRAPGGGLSLPAGN